MRPLFITTLTYSFIALCLSACVDLSGTGLSFRKRAQLARLATETGKTPPRTGEVYTMLGGLGIFSRGMLQLENKIHARFNVPATSIMWYNAGNETQTIIQSQRQGRKPIILIGHSLGANEQIKVARNLDKLGIPVDLLVTVDAVSQTIIPPNVKYAMNVYKPGWVPMFSGLKLRAVNPAKTRIDNMNVTTIPGIRVNHFTIDKDPALQQLIIQAVNKVLGYGNN